MPTDNNIFSRRYVIQRQIGQGGMGIVYQALDRLTGEEVAIKQVALQSAQLLFSGSSPAQMLQQLRLVLAHEFRLLASLRHPNIISVLDYGFDKRQRPYFTMAFLADAVNLLQGGLEQPVEYKVSLIQQMLEAVAYLHRQGILHRDVKPENVLVTEGVVRLLDFGLASARTDAQGSAGTWQYAAPEILWGNAATEASDLYSIGVLAYQLFAGGHPFDVYDPEFLDKVLYEPPDWARLGVGEGLTAVIAKLLEKDPANRYPTAEATIAALSQAVGLPIPPESTSIRDSYLQAAQFVGREEELTRLSTALASAKSGQGSAWLIGGESGVGKSRLINELQIQALVDGFLVLRGQSVEEAGRPYQLWPDAIRQLILEQDVDDLAAGVLKALVPDMDRLLGRDIPAPPVLAENSARQRLFSTIIHLFQEISQPVLLILEDLQWARESLEILSFLNRQTGSLPLLVVGSYRDDEQPDLPGQLAEMNLLPLSRLSEKSMAALSTAMLGEVGQRPEILALLQRETEGNAFFLVEVVRALAEEAGRLSAVSDIALPTRLFPQGIQTIVSRRLSRIPDDVRLLLPGAAVLGRQLDLRLVAELAHTMSAPLELEAWLSSCAEAAVLNLENGRWQFAHDKLREGILAQLVAQERLAWHRRAAEAIESVYPDEPAQAGALVYHWQVVGDEAREGYYARQAGEYARRQFLNAEAIEYLSRALALTAEDDLDMQYALLQQREQIYHLQGERESQLQDLHALESLAKQMGAGGNDQQVETSLRQANYAEAIADYPSAIAAANAALQLAQNSHQEAASYLALGRSLMRQGKFDEAREQFTRSLASAQSDGVLQIEADSYRFLGATAADLSQFDEAKILYQKALPIYQHINDKQGESTVLNNLGVATYSQGDLAGCLIFWGLAERIHDQIGDREGRGRLLTNLSSIYIDLGDFETGGEHSRTALQICREINSRFGECFNLINLGLVAHYQNEWQEAETFSSEAVVVAEKIGSAFLQGLALKDRGYILANQGQLDIAEVSSQQAQKIWAELEQQSQLLETQTILAQIALQQGDVQRALVELGAVVEQACATEMLEGMSRPFYVYLVCYQVLQAVGDGRAEVILRKAASLLQSQAEQITDDKRRRSFQNKVVVHRQIAALAAS